jgi:uncharacterized protein
MRVAVTGATGFIGTALCAELARRGHSAVALTRDPRRAQVALPGVDIVAWNEHSTSLPGVDAVVNLAGESVAGRWTAEKKRRIRDSRIDGTRRLVEAIHRADLRPSVLVSVSGVGYYGDRGEEQLTESSAPGDEFLSAVCRDWEAEAARAEEIGIRVARLRLGVVLDRDGGALAAMLLPFRLGLGGPLGNGRQWFAWIHRADVANLFLFALENAAAAGPINAVAPEQVRNREFTRALARVLHRPAFLPSPAFALRLLLGEFSQELLSSGRVLPERARALGYQFRFPQLAPALRAIMEGPTHGDLSSGARSGRAPAA